MEFRLLGAVEVWAGGQPFDAGQPRQRCVLASLLVDAGRLVAWDTLVYRVWGESPPSGARHSLYSHIARIRRVLASAAAVVDEKPAWLRRQTGGYLLDTDLDLVDLHRFRRLVDRARARDCPDAQRLIALREALGLWRGEPLAGLSGPWANRVRDLCAQQRLDAVVAWARAEHDAGNPADAIGPLSSLLDEHPYVEPLVAALMRALQASGRTALALDCYRAARSRLIDELGVEPGPALQELHRAILSGDLYEPPSARPSGPPAQLPIDVPGFAGRRVELARLDEMLAAASREPSAVVISAVTGTAGVGKTTLAVHWARRVADRFPDGQLYVNLRGFDPAGAAMTTTEALRGFLEALGIPPQRIPASPEAQTGLYRSLLSGRRVLVLLDNARDADQVRALLAGGAGSLIVVTSRRQLAGLITTQSAHPLTLDLLPRVEARELLANRLGVARVAAEPEAVDDIIDRCARLPLALAIVAARAATPTTSSLRVLAAGLNEAVDGLEAFAGDDPVANVRTVFSWSYCTLRPEVARLFRMLGLHPGPDIAAPAAASLLAVPVDRAKGLLAELARAQLVAERTPARFTVHDLLRAYAAELAHECDPRDERRSALRRMLDHYLLTAATADRLLYPRRDRIDLTASQDGGGSPVLAGEAEALAWFKAEHPVVLGAIDLAANAGLDSHAWQLAWCLATYLDRHGHWHEWAATQAVALGAAQRINDRQGQAHTRRGLAGAGIWLGRYEEAYEHLRRAVELFGEIGDTAGQANTELDLAWVFERQGRHDETLEHARRAFDLYREAGHRAGQARALNAVGWAHAQLGDYPRALEHCQRALPLHAEHGDRSGEAYTWDSLGFVRHRLGDHQRAAACYRQAVDIFHALGEQYYEADTLARLGDAQLATGERGCARSAWERAVNILARLDHPDADGLRAKLESMDD